MKKLLCLLFYVFLILPVSAVTLEGSVTYTVEQAREEAFKDVEWEIPKKMIIRHIKDDNYSFYKSLVGGPHSNVWRDRYATYFSDGSYAHRFFDNMDYAFYYNKRGFLTSIEKGLSSSYPNKTYKYNLKGKLVSVSLSVSGDESFVFRPSGELMGHWKGKICYDKDGNVICKRW